jgi:lysophospholipase L1-like esterase
MRKRIVALVSVVIVVILAGTFGIVTVVRSSSGASSYDGFYLDIGASASLGFQPTGIPKHNGHRTNTGYANDLVAIENAKGVSLDLYQIGCPGETAQSMLDKGDACYTLPERQLLRATQFLQENADEAGVVTIDLGFNDVRACLLSVPINQACANEGLALVRQDMPPVLKDLEAVAGPNVHFIGLEYGDPFLGHYVSSAAGEEAATESLQVMTQLNAELATAYTSAGVTVANVPGAFKSDDVAPVALKGVVGDVPTNVAEACTLTWYCTGYPFGPDDHPNNEGYKVIAQTIASVFPPQLSP